MTLVTAYGRLDRAAIIARAQQINRAGATWTEAMRQAHREASDQLRGYFRPSIAIRREAAHA